MKKKFTKELVLVALDLDKKNKNESGCIKLCNRRSIICKVSVECEDRRWKLVAFLSNFLNKTERNYEIHDKKMLAVIEGLEN